MCRALSRVDNREILNRFLSCTFVYRDKEKPQWYAWKNHSRVCRNVQNIYYNLRFHEFAAAAAPDTIQRERVVIGKYGKPILNSYRRSSSLSFIRYARKRVMKGKLVVTLPSQELPSSTPCWTECRIREKRGGRVSSCYITRNEEKERERGEEGRSIKVPVDRAFCIDCRGRQHRRIDAESVVAGLGSHGDPFGPGRCWNPGGALPEALHRSTRKSKARSHRMRAA